MFRTRKQRRCASARSRKLRFEYLEVRAMLTGYPTSGDPPYGWGATSATWDYTSTNANYTFTAEVTSAEAGQDILLNFSGSWGENGYGWPPGSSQNLYVSFYAYVEPWSAVWMKDVGDTSVGNYDPLDGPTHNGMHPLGAFLPGSVSGNDYWGNYGPGRYGSGGYPAGLNTFIPTNLQDTSIDQESFHGIRSFVIMLQASVGVLRDTGGTDAYLEADIVGTAPLAASNSSYAAQPDTTLNFDASTGVLADCNDLSATASLVRGPEHGTLDLEASGAFTYVPDPGYDGPDAFIFAATDGSDSIQRTVSI